MLKVARGIGFVGIVTVTTNDKILGIQKVHGETYVNGIPQKGLSHKEESWVLVDRMPAYPLNLENNKTTRDFMVVTDPYQPTRSIIRRMKGVGEAWIQDRDEDGSTFHVFIQKSFCYLEAPLSRHGSMHKSTKYSDSSVSEASAVDPDTVRYDSFEFGPVSVGLLKGRPLAVLYPLKRAGKIYSVPADESEEDTKLVTNPLLGKPSQPGDSGL